MTEYEFDMIGKERLVEYISVLEDEYQQKKNLVGILDKSNQTYAKTVTRLAEEKTELKTVIKRALAISDLWRMDTTKKECEGEVLALETMYKMFTEAVK